MLYEVITVGFSNQDGGGIDASGNYRNAVLSAEWSYGAITMVREMLAHYRLPTGNPQYDQRAREFRKILERDEYTMLAAMEKLQLKNYTQTAFPGQPSKFKRNNFV